MARSLFGSAATSLVGRVDRLLLIVGLLVVLHQSLQRGDLHDAIGILRHETLRGR